MFLFLAFNQFAFAQEDGPLPSQSCESEDIQVIGDNRDGGTVYKEVCAACHQSDGAGLPDVFPSLQKTAWVDAPPEVLATIILRGVSGKIEVNGASFASYMSPYGTELTDQEIVDVVKYVQDTFGSESASQHPVLTASQVSELRQKNAGKGPIKGQSALDTLLISK